MDAPKAEGMETLLNPDEAAARLRIPRRTLEEWVRAGKVPVVKMGRLHRFRPASLQAFIEAAETRLVASESIQSNQGKTKPFYETATTEEWVAAFMEWAESHRDLPTLPEQAYDRAYFYDDRH